MNAMAIKPRIPAWLRPTPDSMVGRMRERGRNPWFTLVNIVWSCWVFAGLVFGPAGMSAWLSIAISYPLFLLLFALVMVRPLSESNRYVMGFVFLACVNMSFNYSAWTYGVYACAFLPWLDIKRGVLEHGWRMLLVLVPLVAVATANRWPWWAVGVMLATCVFVGLSSVAGQISVRRSIAEDVSSDEVRRLAVTAERERIGRDLHDLLGHTLSLITLKLELSRKLFDRDPAGARAELAEAEKVARKALAEVRAAVTGIRATGLAGELASARLMLRTAGVGFDAGEIPALPDAVDDALALVLRESVTNIHRHAHASRASVHVEVRDARVRMRVRDDGRGGVKAAGNGLDGMRQRVEALSGSLVIHSLPGEGTELCIDMPLPAQAPSADRCSSQVEHAPGGMASLPAHSGGRA